MIVEPYLGLGNEPPVEAASSLARFVAGGKQNRCTVRIEGKCNAPDPLAGIQAQFFHVNSLSDFVRAAIPHVRHA